MFDIPRKAPETQEPTNQPPGWLEAHSETIKEVVALASAGAEKIRSEIAKGADLSPRARKLSLRKLSESVGKSSTYLNSRDYPKVIEYITSINAELELLYSESQEPEGTGQSYTLDEMSRAELLVLAKSQRDELVKLRDEIYVSQLMHLVDSGLLDSQKMIMKRNEDYTKKITELESELSTARSRVSDMDAAYFDVLKQNNELKVKISALSNKSKPSLKSV